MLMNPAEVEKDISSAKFTTIYSQDSPALRLGVCWYLPETSTG
jgi:hypothetical protein